MRKITVFLSIFCLLSLPVCAEDVRESHQTDQRNVEVTVYNNNLALIKDVRKVNLSKGVGELRFMDVAAYIMPETVHVKPTNISSVFRVLEQNYEYDLMDRSKLLDKFVGRDIRLLETNQYKDSKQFVDAHLLSNNSNQQIYRIGDEIYLGHPGIPVLPEIPKNLIAKPTLTWMYENNSKTDEVEVSYLTTQMSWKADYVLVLNQDDTMADISGWVTINNKSGTAYEEASLKLIAGEVNRAQPEIDFRQNVRAKGMLMEMAGAPQFEEKGFFEYHIYDLQRKTTLKDNQTKQINLLEAQGFDIKKEYLVHGARTYYNYAYQEQMLKQPVNVNVTFKNSKENKLGMPLPKGTIRLYKQDDEKALQFVGEDNIDHTPKDEKVSVKVGEAFDVVAEKKQTSYKVVTSNVSETAWEITLKNHKEEDVVVSVIEPIFGDWQMLSTSHEFEKVDAFTIRYDVNVPKDEEVKIQYRVRVKY